MIDWKKPLVSILETVGLPVYYELFVDSSIETPCITYIENDNSSLVKGETMEYSKIAFTVKVWGSNLAILMPYCNSIDIALKKAGFERTLKQELAYEMQLQIVMRYEANGLERF